MMYDYVSSPCYVMLCYTMLWYVPLCYVILYMCMYVYIYIYIYICIYSYVRIHTYIHASLPRSLGPANGPRRERVRGRRESAAGAGPGTTQGKMNRQTARLKWVLWRNHASMPSTAPDHNGQWGGATSRSLAGDHARLP